MQGKNGYDIRNKQEKSYQNEELIFSGFEKSLKNAGLWKALHAPPQIVAVRLLVSVFRTDLLMSVSLPEDFSA